MFKNVSSYIDKWKLNFWCWALCSVHRSRNIMLYPWNLYNIINQCYLNRCFHVKKLGKQWNTIFFSFYSIQFRFNCLNALRFNILKKHNISLFIKRIHVSDFEINVWGINRDTGSVFELLDYLLRVNEKLVKYTYLKYDIYIYLNSYRHSSLKYLYLYIILISFRTLRKKLVHL